MRSRPVRCCGPRAGSTRPCRTRSSRRPRCKRTGSPDDIARAALFLRGGSALRHGPDPRGRRRTQHLTRLAGVTVRAASCLVAARGCHARSTGRIACAAASPACPATARPACAARSGARGPARVSAAGPEHVGPPQQVRPRQREPRLGANRVAVQQDVEVHRARRPLRRQSRSRPHAASASCSRSITWCDRQVGLEADARG